LLYRGRVKIVFVDNRLNIGTKLNEPVCCRKLRVGADDASRNSPVSSASRFDNAISSAREPWIDS
jgi:hypothetical protein